MLNLNGISIRPAADSELPLIKELARRIWPETYGKILTPAQIDYMIEMMYALPVLQRERGEGISFDLICDGDRPVGFLSYGPYRKEPLTMKLHKLYLKLSKFPLIKLIFKQMFAINRFFTKNLMRWFLLLWSYNNLLLSHTTHLRIFLLT